MYRWAKSGMIKLLELLEREANVNSFYKGSPVLYHMGRSKTPHIEISKLLIDRGADVNLRSNMLIFNYPIFLQPSPLSYALKSGNVEMAILLLERGAKIENVDFVQAAKIAGVQEGVMPI